MTIEVMKQALEALRQARDNTTHGQIAWNCKEAINRIDQAIAEAEKQEPVAYANDDWSRIDFPSNKVPTKGGPLYTSSPQRCPNCDSLERQNAELDLKLAEQEQPPFGFLTNRKQRFNFEPNMTGLQSMPMTIDWKIPLYGSPQPQRQWVDLSDDEIDSIDWKAVSSYARAIEAKLKEKNT